MVEGFMKALAVSTAAMGLLALMIKLVSPLYLKHFSAKSAYLVWVVVMIGFLIPFRPSMPAAAVKWTLPQTGPVIITLPAPRTPQKTAQQRPTIPTQPAAPAEQPPARQPVLPAQTAQISQTVPDKLSLTAWEAAFILYLCGVCTTLGFSFWRYRRFMRVLKRWRRPVQGGPCLEKMAHIQAHMHIRRRIPLYHCAAVGSPMAAGLMRPALYLPQVDADAEGLPFILRHELTHLKRGDLYGKLLAMLAAAMHFFNPLVYLAAREMSLACEAACDESIAKGLPHDQRHLYSQTLLRAMRPATPVPSLTTCFKGGKKEMKMRIRHILFDGKKRAGAAAVALAVLLTSLTGLAFTLESDISLQNVDVNKADFAALKGQAAVLNAPDGYAAVYTHYVDYQAPYALYLNGAQVTIDQVLASDGPFGASARVHVGTVSEGGAVFGVPLQYLAIGEDTQVKPQQATVWKGAALYGDMHFASRNIAYFEAGTVFDILGWYGEWYHVKVKGQMGFVLAECFLDEEETVRFLNLIKPEKFTQATQKAQKAYWDYRSAYQAKRALYGDYFALWPLEEKVWDTQQEVLTGSEYLYIAYQLPGEGDLPQAQALKIAKQTFMDKRQLDESDVDTFQVGVGFYTHPSDDPEQKMWRVDYMLPNGENKGQRYNFYVVISSPDGAVLETSAVEDAPDEPAVVMADVPMVTPMPTPRSLATITPMPTPTAEAGDVVPFIQSSPDNVSATPAPTPQIEQADETSDAEREEASLLATYEIVYGPYYAWPLAVRQEYSSYDYGSGFNDMPGENEWTQEQALAAALTAVKDTFGLTDEALKAYDPYFFFEQTHIRTWRVMLYEREREANGVLTGYKVILLAKDGQIVSVTQPKAEDYVYQSPEAAAPELLAGYQHDAMLVEMEALYGPAAFWTLEQMAELAKNSPLGLSNTLPGEGDLTQQQAYEKACDILKRDFELTDEALSKCYVHYAFLDWGSHREWQLEIYPGGIADVGDLRNLSYLVSMDGQTGELLMDVSAPGTTNG